MALKLTELARIAIEAHLKSKKLEIDRETKKEYSKKGASFVTLTKNGELRGCIGSLEAFQALWKDVIENAINAGFRDFRFHPLTNEEFSQIKIEVSVLSEPKKIAAEKINNTMGIILKHGMNTSTFLPQVWEELPDKTDFLEHLSMKAGLDKNAWKDSELWYYNVEKQKE